jgi:molybdopterin synthase sulfur carrier subunit
VNVRFYATLRQVAGRREVEIPGSAGGTVRELLDAVLERWPPMREELFDEQGRLYGHVHVFINGRDAPYMEHGLETRLASDDAVDIFPAVGGG